MRKEIIASRAGYESQRIQFTAPTVFKGQGSIEDYKPVGFAIGGRIQFSKSIDLKIFESVEFITRSKHVLTGKTYDHFLCKTNKRPTFVVCERKN